jgi:cardiolipin synthase
MELTAQIWALLLTALDYAIVVVLVPRIITERRESAATLAWVLAIVFLPFLGALCYALFGARRLRRQRLLYRDRTASLAQAMADAQLAETDRCVPDHPAERELCAVLRDEAGLPVPGNQVEILNHPAAAYDRILEAISSARQTVHMEYYIFQADETGQRFLDALAERARAGVEVRLLVDAVGSWRLGRRTLQALAAHGAKTGVFNPLRLWSNNWGFHLRNHRKIVIVDGRVGFTGGLNIGDRFRGRRSALGPWRDTHLRIEGPAAARLQAVFAGDWHFVTGELLAADRYYPAGPGSGQALVQVVASGPDSGCESIHRAIFTSLNVARRRAWMTTPYFVPDQSVMVAMKVAALRGVDVRLLVPGRSDHPLVFWAGRSLYQELLESGVKIYEYRPGMLHAKIMTVDGHIGVVGSANIDRRSFSLNFEASAVLYDRALVGKLEAQFEADLEPARRVTLPLERTRMRRLVEGASFVLAPLL